jgi:3,4-dihydroxy 2-butanone 4-phosphate synthase / GTP cyclohydrolase II
LILGICALFQKLYSQFHDFNMNLNSIEDIIQDIRQGKMVILMDDEDRENEGDLVMAAEKVRPEDINFMTKFGRGLVCLTLTNARCQQLQLPLMVNDNTSTHATNFTVSIEAARGVTTGISAADRATTIRAAVAPNAKPSDLVQPGHIFPLMAQAGGVLRRAGHTEAGCDLARLAGLEPASAIVEILNEDGTMARRSDLEAFAQQHSLKIGTIADLIQYRIHHEKTVEHVAQCRLPTDFGEFKLHLYQDTIDNSIHLVMVKGEISPTEPTLVRVHIRNSLCDLTGSLREACGWPLRNVIERVAKEGKGIVMILRRDESPEQLIQRVRNCARRDTGEDLPIQSQNADLRTFGLGAQILSDLGVRQMRVLSAPKKFHAISGFGLEVVEYVEN